MGESLMLGFDYPWVKRFCVPNFETLQNVHFLNKK